jgi:hypothetical protein
VTPDDPPIFMEYPKEKGQPVIGAVQPDATHSAVHGLKLAEALRAAGVEVVLTYPASPDPNYPTMASFLIAKRRVQYGAVARESGKRRARAGARALPVHSDRTKSGALRNLRRIDYALLGEIDAAREV